MKKKDQLKVKLTVIRMLSDPDIIIESFRCEHEMGPFFDPGPWGLASLRPNGRATYTFVIFRKDKEDENIKGAPDLRSRENIKP